MEQADVKSKTQVRKMRHDNSKKLFMYWNRVRGDRAAPGRDEIEPVNFQDILGDTFIVELDPQCRTFNFRLAGTRLCSAHTRELKGESFLSMWSEQDTQAVYNRVKNVINKCEPCIITYVSKASDHLTVNYEMLLLPLTLDSGDTNRILGIASPFEIPMWLGSVPLQQNKIKFTRPLETDAAKIQITAPPLAMDNPSQETADKKVGHLTLIEGGASQEI